MTQVEIRAGRNPAAATDAKRLAGLDNPGHDRTYMAMGDAVAASFM
jgi:hypothetical protein